MYRLLTRIQLAQGRKPREGTSEDVVDKVIVQISVRKERELACIDYQVRIKASVVIIDLVYVNLRKAIKRRKTYQGIGFPPLIETYSRTIAVRPAKAPESMTEIEFCSKFL